MGSQGPIKEINKNKEEEQVIHKVNRNTENKGTGMRQGIVELIGILIGCYLLVRFFLWMDWLACDFAPLCFG